MEDKLIIKLREAENTPVEVEKPIEAVKPAEVDMKKCEVLAEKLYIVKHLKEQKDITDKQKKFIDETENIELTEKERDAVLEFYTKLVPKGK